MVRYRTTPRVLRHNPLTISLYALASYNAHQETRDPQHLEGFSLHAQWLLRSFTSRGDWGVWSYDFDFASPIGRCRKPWASSMAQGAGISALIRYHALTEEARALRVAREALGAYRVPIAEGGVLRVDAEDRVWFEEYACPGTATALNGFMTALVGAKELALYANDEAAEEVFALGLRTLESRLDDFELRLPFMRWTRYDDRDLVHAGREYHSLHIRQLRALADLTEGQHAELLREYNTRWGDWQERYGTSPLFRPYELLSRGWTLTRGRLRRRGGVREGRPRLRPA